MNNCSFIGRIGRDAQTRYTQAGKPVTGWSLAIDRGFGDNKQTTWLDCSGWGERFAKLAEYIRKGDRLGVVGEIGTREHDGKTYVTLDVRDLTLLGDKRDQGDRPQRQQRERPSPQQRPSGGAVGGGFDDDDIPFASPITRRNWSALS